MRLKTTFKGTGRKKTSKTGGKKEVGKKYNFFQLHQLTLWDTD